MNKLDVIDELMKSLIQRKKDFISNQDKLRPNDSLKNFVNGQISGIQEAMDILLDERIRVKAEQEKISCD